jgi:rfaE bifunctional protein nucleotidyltransferase chain/domain
VSGGPLVIVGDALLDRDVDGRAERLCPDAPVPVVESTASGTRPGGAALAALLAVRGATAGDGTRTGPVVLVTPLGADPASAEIRRLLGDAVTIVPVPLDGPLQEKTRIRAAGRTLLRVDNDGGKPGPAGEQAAAAIMSAGVVLVSDYGRGITADPLIRDSLAHRAERAPVVWDPHPRGSTPVPGASLVTPNEREALSLAASQGPDAPGTDSDEPYPPGPGVRGAVATASGLLLRWRAQGVAVTLGARGALLARRGQSPLAIPAPPVAAADPCGAGDQFAVAAATALRDGALLSEAVTGAVMAASRYLADGGVERLTTAASASRGSADGPSVSGHPAHSEPGPADHGGLLVATGGCFDVLHAGHVSMLHAARSLGDRLVVCLNSDDSVRRLKGPSRPVNPVGDRATVLRALGCVDDVVVFDEDTPERVLDRLRPAIWVKGGDYDASDLPEADVLRRWNGIALTVPYLDGRSTTRILRSRLADV